MKLMPLAEHVAEVALPAAMMSVRTRSTSCWWRWMASRQLQASWCWQPPTGQTFLTRRCSGLAGGDAAAECVYLRQHGPVHGWFLHCRSGLTSALLAAFLLKVVLVATNMPDILDRPVAAPGPADGATPYFICLAMLWSQLAWQAAE